MRARSPLSTYNRAMARSLVSGFHGLAMMAVNELQLFYIFVKLSGVTDGLYENYLNPSFNFKKSIMASDVRFEDDMPVVIFGSDGVPIHA